MATAAQRTNPGSFRDPSGYVYEKNNVIYRKINLSYVPHYECLMKSGLYERLASANMLIPHECAGGTKVHSDGLHIKPDRVPFISYPYEWCFSQLKDAAYLTLSILRKSLDHNMILKDASAFNIQFLDGKPIHIDTLSFEQYEEGKPWIAYRQFCQHFLAPLLLMSKKDIRFGQLTRIFLDGIPLDFASRLLPRCTLFQPTSLLHIHLHARFQRRFADRPHEIAFVKKNRMSRKALFGMVESLMHIVENLEWSPKGTPWGDYYDSTNYTGEAQKHKVEIVRSLLRGLEAGVVWDIGANTGRYSIIAAEENHETIAFDIDPGCIETAYRWCKDKGKTRILPLILDIMNPSPAIGWNTTERPSIFERGRADTVLALALVHHLAIANNVPLPRIASLFRRLCTNCIVEFVPKIDSQVRRLLSRRKDIFPQYSQEEFERAFSQEFHIEKIYPISKSKRVLYLLNTR